MYIKKVRLFYRDVLKMLQLSLPIIIAQLGSVFFGIIDTIMVGNMDGKIGKDSLAAAGFANTLFFLIACVGIGIFAAIAPLVAKAKGSKDRHECGLIFYGGMKISFLVGAIQTVVLLVLCHFFWIFDQKPEVATLAVSYLRVIAFSTVPMMFFLAVKNFSDGLSFTKPAMIITVSGLIINVFFNWILIYGNLGFSGMGLYGSGLATLVARVIMACFMIIYVLESKFFQQYLPNILAQHPTALFSKKILKLGFPSGMMYFFEMGAFFGVAVIVGRISTGALAASNIILSIATFTYMLAAGVSFAGAISVGSAMGVRNRAKILREGKISIGLVVTLMLISSLLLLFFGRNVIHLYNKEDDVLQVALPLLSIFIFYQLADGIQAVGVGILRGLSDVNIPTFIAIFSYWIIGLPLSYVLSEFFWLGVQGAWIGLSVGLGISAVLLTTRFFILAKKDNLMMNEKPIVTVDEPHLNNAEL